MCELNDVAAKLAHRNATRDKTHARAPNDDDDIMGSLRCVFAYEFRSDQ